MSMPAKPFIMSLFPPVAPPPLSPNKPKRSSIVDAGAVVAGDAIRCGVPARPSSPDAPEEGCVCNEAGAAPSKSMSRRFSTLDSGWALPPATAAATAAIGFSIASCFCSLYLR